MNLSELERISELLCLSKGTNDRKIHAQNVLIMLKGGELGLEPMQSLDAIDVIQGKLALKPAAMLALIMKSGKVASYRCDVTDTVATIMVTRAGDTEKVFTFTMNEAKAMNLTGRQQWQAQPKVMLEWRCVSRMAMRLFGDVIQGLYNTEEVSSFMEVEVIPPAQVTAQVTPQLTAQSTQPTPPAQPAQSERDLAWQALCDIVDVMGLGENPTTVWKMAIARYGKPMDNDVQGWRKWVTEFSADYQNDNADKILFSSLDKPSPANAQPAQNTQTDTRYEDARLAAWNELKELVILSGMGESPNSVWHGAIEYLGTPTDAQGWRNWIVQFKADYQHSKSDDDLFNNLDKPAPVAQPKPVGNVPLNQTPARAGNVVVITRCVYKTGLTSKKGGQYDMITMYFHDGSVNWMQGRKALAAAVGDDTIKNWVSGETYQTNFEVVLGQNGNYLEVAKINPINPTDIPF